MYVCMHVCMYIIYACMYIRMCIVYVCMYVCIIRMCIRMCIVDVCMYVCLCIMYVCIYVCMCIMYVWMYVCMCIMYVLYALSYKWQDEHVRRFRRSGLGFGVSSAHSHAVFSPPTTGLLIKQSTPLEPPLVPTQTYSRVRETSSRTIYITIFTHVCVCICIQITYMYHKHTHETIRLQSSILYMEASS